MIDERALIVATVNLILAIHALRLAILDKAATVEILLYLEVTDRRLTELINVVGRKQIDEGLRGIYNL